MTTNGKRHKGTDSRRRPDKSDDQDLSRRQFVGGTGFALAMSLLGETSSSRDGATFLQSSEDSEVVGEVNVVDVGQNNGGEFHTEVFRRRYDEPIVIAKPLTYNGSQPAHLRLRNVSETGFSHQVEEWDYLDEYHTGEFVAYLAVETGVHRLWNGPVIEVGKTSVDETPKRVSFANPREEPPVVFSQPQTWNGPQAVVARNANVTGDGFQVRLQEEEGNNNRHRMETVGYVYLTTSGGGNDGFEVHRTADRITDDWHRVNFTDDYGPNPVFLADLQTSDGSNPVGVRRRNLTGTDVELLAEEEGSANDETRHDAEMAGYFVLDGPRLLRALKATNTIGEIGREEAAATGTNDWHTVTLSKRYEDPVVVMNPLSANGPHAAHVRVRNVSARSFEYKIEEWGAAPGEHTTEVMSYLVVESGINSPLGGPDLYAGTVPISGSEWSHVQFNVAASLGERPVVLSQVQTFNGSDAIVTRQRDVRGKDTASNPSGFTVRLQEREANPEHHVSETLGFIALRREAGETSGKEYAVGRTDSGVDGEWQHVEFGRDLGSPPCLLAAMQTTNGPNAANLRYRDLDPTGVDLRVAEEESADAETWHVDEQVGYVSFGGTGQLKSM